MAVSSNEYDRLLSGIKGLDARLHKLEQQGGASDVILLKLDHMNEEIKEVRRGIEKINGRVTTIEDRKSQHEVRIAVMERFCHEQVTPALQLINENRVELATIVAKYGAGGLGFGGILGAILFAVGKAAGWW